MKCKKGKKKCVKCKKGGKCPKKSRTLPKQYQKPKPKSRQRSSKKSKGPIDGLYDEVMNAGNSLYRAGESIWTGTSQIGKGIYEAKNCGADVGCYVKKAKQLGTGAGEILQGVGTAYKTYKKYF